MKNLLVLLLLVSGTANASPTIWASGQLGKWLPSLGWELFDQKQYRSATVDPSAGAGIVAPIGSVIVRDNAGAGQLWLKTGAANTAWSEVPTGATNWLLAGNLGTGGTGVLGTTDAQPFNIIANNLSVASILSSHRGILADNPIVPADATAVDQYSFRTVVNPTVSTTGASHSSLYSRLEWDSINAGFNNASGSLVPSSSSFVHSGSGTINYAATNSNQANFNNAGVTTQFRGVTSENNISAGTTVSDYTGVISGVTTSAGIVGTSNGFSNYGNFTNATISYANGVTSSMTFDGTTANGQGATGLNSGMNFLDSTTTVNGVNGINSTINIEDTSAVSGTTGANVYISAKDTATHGGTTVVSAGFSQEGAAVNPTGVLGFSSNLQFFDSSSTGGVTLFNGYTNTDDTAHLDSLVGINLNPEIQGTSDVDNVTMGTFAGQIRGSSTVDNLTGVNIDTQMSGSAAVTNFTGLMVSPKVNGTSVLTNGLTGIQVTPQSAADVSSVKGINVDVSAVTLSAAAIAAGEKLTGISNNGSFDSSYTYTIPGATTFFQTNYLGGAAAVAAGDPVSTFGFGNNFAHTVDLADDWTLDGFGLGFVNVGFVGALDFDAGTTMARWTGALGGAGNPAGAGTLTDAIMFRSAGVLPQGGALTVTNMYGFQVDPAIFCTIGTNCWGFYEDTAAAENHLSKLAIGTATKKVANSSTAVEIGNNKALLNGRGTTAQRTALTALAGMQFYDTTLNELYWHNGTAWVLATGGTPVPSWALAGNAGTTPGTDFLGTTDALDLVFKTNNVERLRVSSTGAYDTTLGAGVVHSDASGILTSSAVSLTADVTGVLPIANGGTNSSTALNNDRVMVSSAGAIVEAAALTDGQLLIGDTGAAPVAAALTGTANQVTVTNGAGSITLSTPQDIATTSSPTFANTTLTNSLILQDPGAGVNIWTVQSPTLAADYVLTLPTNDGGAGEFLQTDGNGVTTWAAGGSGTVNTGVAGRLGLYPANGTAVDDTYVQNANDINLFVAAHPALAATRTYTVPEVGADADFVMSAGAQTVGGIKTLSATPLLKTAIDLEDPAAGTNKWTVQSPTLAADYTLTLPVDDGANEQVLSTNGSGVTSWVSVVPTASAVGASAIDWALVKIGGGLFTKTLSANTTFTFSNLLAGQTITVRLTNTASNYTVTWPTVKWPSNVTPVMTTGAKSDVYTFVYDGTDIFGSYVQDF